MGELAGQGRSFLHRADRGWSARHPWRVVAAPVLLPFLAMFVITTSGGGGLGNTAVTVHSVLLCQPGNDERREP